MTEATAPDLTPPIKTADMKAPDLTPPVKAEKPKKNGKSKADKVEKAPKEPKAAKPKGNYGYSKDATIELVPEKETKYRGQRAEWFEIVKAHAGRKVSDFNEAAKGKVNGKGTVQTPSGWLRFYVLDGSVKLVPPAAEVAKESLETT